jgi:hypothetical protein
LVSASQPELERFPEPQDDLSADVKNYQLELEEFLEASFIALAAPRPLQFEESVRSMITSDIYAKEGYCLLYDQVGPHNPDRIANFERLLPLCYGELTATLIRFLAGREEEQILDELRDFDLPPELPELDPHRWTIEDVARAKRDLQTVVIPGSNWKLRAPLPPAPAIALDV